jgi:NADPH:quinone reductase-like Zn-dependent oxidoreductase
MPRTSWTWTRTSYSTYSTTVSPRREADLGAVRMRSITTLPGRFPEWPCRSHQPSSRPAVSLAAEAGLTALSLLRAGRFEVSGKESSAAGQGVVLVMGVAGRVGSAVVPLLAAAGVHVIATAIPDDDQYALDLGAAEVIDYHSVDVIAETMRRHPEGVDALINLALPGPALVEASRVIRPGGRLLNAAFPSPDPSAFDGAGLTVQTVYSTARPGDLDRLAAYEFLTVVGQEGDQMAALAAGHVHRPRDLGTVGDVQDIAEQQEEFRLTIGHPPRRHEVRPRGRRPVRGRAYAWPPAG